MGRKSVWEGISVCVWLIHFAVLLKLTQHCKSTMLSYKITFKKNKVRMGGQSGKMGPGGLQGSQMPALVSRPWGLGGGAE